MLLSICSLKNIHIYAAVRIKVCYAAFRILAWNLITTSSKVRWCFFCSLCSFYVSHLSHRDYAALCKTILCVRTCVSSSIVFLYLFVCLFTVAFFLICNWTKEVYNFNSHLRSPFEQKVVMYLLNLWYFCETSFENIFCPSEIFFFSYIYINHVICLTLFNMFKLFRSVFSVPPRTLNFVFSKCKQLTLFQITTNENLLYSQTPVSSYSSLGKTEV